MNTIWPIAISVTATHIPIQMISGCSGWLLMYPLAKIVQSLSQAIKTKGRLVIFPIKTSSRQSSRDREPETIHIINGDERIRCSEVSTTAKLLYTILAQTILSWIWKTNPFSTYTMRKGWVMTSTETDRVPILRLLERKMESTLCGRSRIHISLWWVNIMTNLSLVCQITEIIGISSLMTAIGLDMQKIRAPGCSRCGMLSRRVLQMIPKAAPH